MRTKILLLILPWIPTLVLASDLWSARNFNSRVCYLARSKLDCKDCTHCSIYIFPGSPLQMGMPVDGEIKSCQTKSKTEGMAYFEFNDLPKPHARVFSLVSVSQTVSGVLQIGEGDEPKVIACPAKNRNFH